MSYFNDTDTNKAMENVLKAEQLKEFAPCSITADVVQNEKGLYLELEFIPVVKVANNYYDKLLRVIKRHIINVLQLEFDYASIYDFSEGALSSYLKVYFLIKDELQFRVLLKILNG